MTIFKMKTRPCFGLKLSQVQLTFTARNTKNLLHPGLWLNVSSNLFSSPVISIQSSRRISGAQQGENRAGSCSNTGSFLPVLSAENAPGRRQALEDAGCWSLSRRCLAKLLRAQMARSSASTQQHKHVKAADSRWHTSARTQQRTGPADWNVCTNTRAHTASTSNWAWD